MFSWDAQFFTIDSGNNNNNNDDKRNKINEIRMSEGEQNISFHTYGHL